MSESISELRKKVQEPVSAYNDVAGLLVGDRLSIHVTAFFIRMRWSPTVGTLAMLAFGIVGSCLLPFGAWWSVAGFACVFLYYIFDCVDGEVARYWRREKLAWGFHDFMFHLFVKSAFFVALGVYLVRLTGEAWTFLIALAALVATLFSKALYDVAIILGARYVIMRPFEARERFVREMTDGLTPGEADDESALPGERRAFRLDNSLSAARLAVTNFDLSTILFLLAALADLWLAPFPVFGLQCDLKALLAVFYGVVLPLDFLDRWVTYIRTDRFRLDSRELYRRAHQFRLWRER